MLVGYKANVVTQISEKPSSRHLQMMPLSIFFFNLENILFYTAFELLYQGKRYHFSHRWGVCWGSIFPKH